MKTNGFVLILLILCLMLASCGYVTSKVDSDLKDLDHETTPAETSPAETTPTETTPAETTAPGPRGIYLSLESVGDSYVKVIWHNNTDHQINFGEFYTIEVYRDGQWEEIPHPPIAYPSVAIGLLPHSQTPKSYSLSPFELTEGEAYRVRSYFSPHTGGSYDIYQQFEWPAQN